MRSATCEHWAESFLSSSGAVHALAPEEKLTRVTKAEVIRRIVHKGEFNSRYAARLAISWGCSTAEVWDAIYEAGAIAAAETFPRELALEESVDLARRVRAEAERAHDWKSALAAQTHIDRLLGTGARGDGRVPAAPASDMVPRAQAIADLKRLKAVFETAIAGIEDPAVRAEVMARVRQAIAAGQ